MDSTAVKKLIRDDSLEEFEFIDVEGDLNLDLLDSPVQGTEGEGTTLSKVFSVLSSVIEKQDFLVTLQPKILAVAAVGAIAGSALGGPPGLAAGLITGTVLAYRASPRRAKSPAPQQGKSTIRQIFNRMTLEQKKELLRELLGCLKHSNVRSLLLEIVRNENIRSMAIDVLSKFLMTKLGVCLNRPK